MCLFVGRILFCYVHQEVTSDDLILILFWWHLDIKIASRISFFAIMWHEKRNSLLFPFKAFFPFGFGFVETFVCFDVNGNNGLL